MADIRPSEGSFSMLAATAICLIFVLALDGFAQATLGSPEEQITIGRPAAQSQTPASPGWPFGRPHTRVKLEGLLIRSDGETLSIELADQRVIRFRLNAKTSYFLDAKPGNLTGFHMTDFVQVDSEVESKGLLLARSVRFVRKASPDEQSEIFQSPELLARWRANVLAGTSLDPAREDRKLISVTKPEPITGYGRDTLEPTEFVRGNTRQAGGASPGGEDELISLVRRSVTDAHDKLPNFRARQVTSMFKSFSKPVKWVPDGLVTTEIAYEGDRESYSDIQIDGKQPVDAPETADPDYMRSLNRAWSTGDFETISHCVFSELADSDFRKARTEQSNSGTLVIYEFTGRRSSGCIGVNFKSQITYPAYKGLMKVRAQTGEVLHVELGATEIPAAFPLDRAERSVDFRTVRIADTEYLLPATAFWFGCFRNSYSCFLNRIDFRDYRRFQADSTLLVGK
jgi:hypothetical protein